MAYPITGPFYKRVEIKSFLVGVSGTPPPGFTGNVYYEYDRTWHRQKLPYNMFLPYTFVSRQVTKFVDTRSSWNYRQGTYGLPPTVVLDGETNAKAYAKFKGMAQKSAGFAETIAERQKSCEMIAKRGLQFYRFIKNLTSLNFVGAAQALNIPGFSVTTTFRKPPAQWLKRHGLESWRGYRKGELLKWKAGDRSGYLRKHSQAFSSNYLEFYFGWRPLVGAIQESVEALIDPFPPVTCKGKGRTKSISKTVETSSDWFAPFRKTSSIGRDITVTIRAILELDNSAQWLATQLQFTNPLALAWELTPFSVVVNWFVNIRDILESLTDFNGIRMSNVHTTQFYKLTSDEDGMYYIGKPTQYVLQSSNIGIYCQRSGGFSTPSKLVFKNPFRNLHESKMKATAMISLLITQGISKR